VAMPDTARTNVTANARAPRLTGPHFRPAKRGLVRVARESTDRPFRKAGRPTMLLSFTPVERCRGRPRIRGGTPATTWRRRA
jgi:hypothetical protein